MSDHTLKEPYSLPQGYDPASTYSLPQGLPQGFSPVVASQYSQAHNDVLPTDVVQAALATVPRPKAIRRTRSIFGIMNEDIEREARGIQRP